MDKPGPMPLMLSSSAWLALLTSTAACAANAKAARMKVMRMRSMMDLQAVGAFGPARRHAGLKEILRVRLHGRNPLKGGSMGAPIGGLQFQAAPTRPSARRSRAGLDVAQPAVAPAGQRVRRVDLAVKDDDARAVRHERLAPQVARPARDAVVLEAAAPLRWPVGELALAVQHLGQEGLLVAQSLAHLFLRGAELGQHLGMRADDEAAPPMNCR